jgi:hypothetical protein
LRFFSLTTTPVFQKATILNDCPKIGVHYIHRVGLAEIDMQFYTVHHF